MIDVVSIFQEAALEDWRQSIIDADLEGVFDLYSDEEVVTKFEQAFEHELNGRKLDVATIAFWREQLREEIRTANKMRNRPALQPIITIASVLAGIGLILIVEIVLLDPDFSDWHLVVTIASLVAIGLASVQIIRSRSRKRTHISTSSDRPTGPTEQMKDAPETDEP